MHERFDCLYGEEELKEWVPRVRELAGSAWEVHVLFNNCHRDNVVVNPPAAGRTSRFCPRRGGPVLAT